MTEEARPSRVQRILNRIFRRGHPDIYQAMKAYADKKGIRVDDAVAAACSGYLAADDEGRTELEKAIEDKRSSGRGGSTDLKPAIEMFTTMCNAMGQMFNTMNSARASLQSSSLIADYKAVTQAASEIKKLGGEGGSGSLEDKAADWFLGRLFGGDLKIERKSGRKTGQDKVEEVGKE